MPKSAEKPFTSEHKAWERLAEGQFGGEDSAVTELHGLSSPNAQKRAYAEYERVQSERGGLPETVVDPLVAEDADEPVARYASLILVPMKPTRLKKADAWLAYGELARDDGRLILRSLSLAPLNATFAASGLNHRVWQVVRPPQILEAATRQFERTADWSNLVRRAGWLQDDEERARGEQTEAVLRTVPRRRGREGYGERFYRDFAIRWLEVQNDPARGRRGVLQTLAAEYDVAVSVIRTWAKTAEELRFLGKAPRGYRASREAGPRLYAPDGAS